MPGQARKSIIENWEEELRQIFDDAHKFQALILIHDIGSWTRLLGVNCRDISCHHQCILLPPTSILSSFLLRETMSLSLLQIPAIGEVKTSIYSSNNEDSSWFSGSMHLKRDASLLTVSFSFCLSNIGLIQQEFQCVCCLLILSRLFRIV